MRNFIDINKLSNIPLYLQLKDSIKDAILEGSYKEDEQLPTEEVICNFYAISRPVVRKAYQALIDEGLVVRKQGSGTFVKRNLVLANIMFRSDYTTALAQHGIKASSRIFSLEIIHKNEVELLKNEKYDAYYLIRRARYGNNVPLLLEHFYFPLDIFFDLKDQLSNEISFTQIVTQYYQVGDLDGITQMNALVMDDGMAMLFDVPKGSAAIKFTFFNRYLDGSLCFHKISYFPGNRHRIDLEVNEP